MTGQQAIQSQLKEQVVSAIEARDLKAVGRFVDHMRFEVGLNYAGVLELVQGWVPGMDEGEWDQLLAEVDEMEGRS
jgi:hypothetical protein